MTMSKDERSTEPDATHENRPEVDEHEEAEIEHAVHGEDEDEERGM